MSVSLQEYLGALSFDQQEEYVALLDESQRLDLVRKPWWFIGRPEQQEPEGDWSVWLILAGRGWGKTRTGAEWLMDQILKYPKAPDGTPTEWAIIGETFSDTRVMCVEGPSGIIRVLERRGMKNGEHYQYNRSTFQVVFAGGQKIHMFGADNPDAGRGYNLAGVWADEIAKWRYSYESWVEGIAPALRIGERPRAVVTTTPKPIRVLREWTTRTDGSVAVTRGSTFDNASNLSRAALTELEARYRGTRVGRQELYGELLDDVEGALWSRRIIDDFRIAPEKMPSLVRIVVAIDPAVTSGEESDETGIIVAGRSADGHFYVLSDKSCRTTPDHWARIAIGQYEEYKADKVVAETNNGGDMVVMLLNTVNPAVPVKKVSATRGKRVRAEPVSSLYEQGRVHHVGTFPQLEDQMIVWTPDSADSPDRLDALVWALTELMSGGSSMIALAGMAKICQKCGMPSIKTASACTSCGEALIEENHG